MTAYVDYEQPNSAKTTWNGMGKRVQNMSSENSERGILLSLTNGADIVL